MCAFINTLPRSVRHFCVPGRAVRVLCVILSINCPPVALSFNPLKWVGRIWSLIKNHRYIVFIIKASVNPVTQSNGLPVGIILWAGEWSVHPQLTPLSNATHTVRDSGG
jgi:hypothetical protein